MSKAKENFEQALFALVDEAGASVAMGCVTGAFVGMVIGVMEQNGHDAGGEIKIDGGTNRDITIHAVKPKAEEGKKP